MKLSELLAQLQREGLIESASVPPEATGMPWYLRLATAFGAWISTFFLLIFFLILAEASELLAILTGSLQCGLAVLFARRRRSEFSSQLGLSLWLTGAGLLVYGLCSNLSSGTELWASILCLVGLSFFYPERLGKLLTVLAAGLFLTVLLCWDDSVPGDAAVFALAMVGGFCCVARDALWRRGWHSATYVYGTGALLTLLFVLIVSYWDWARVPAGEATSFLLTLGVLWVAARVLRQLNLRPLQALWALGGVLGLGLLTLQTPGIMAGIGVMLLGFQARSRLLQVLAVIYLLLFISTYYYYLATPLLHKSLMLFASGLLLLALRRGLVRS